MVLTQGSPQLHFEALVDSGCNYKPKAMLSFLPRVSAHPVTPGRTVPGPTSWKDNLKRGKQESLPKPASYSWTLGTSKYWKLMIQTTSCAVSPPRCHETQRLQEGHVQEPFPRGLSATKSLGKRIHQCRGHSRNAPWPGRESSPQQPSREAGGRMHLNGKQPLH